MEKKNKLRDCDKDCLRLVQQLVTSNNEFGFSGNIKY